jgi:D-3-phosphoglycerate dehydrogenase / 2-oxoglutarate reductase
MNTLGVILARGGSKGIPNKNIKPIHGKPLIAYTIEAGLKSNVFSELIVSTDSEEIARIAEEFGALVPFMRPDELAGDTVWSRDALKHAVLESEKIFEKEYDYVIELPCIAPLRNEVHIQESYAMLSENKSDSVTSVAQMGDKHPVRMKRIVDGLLKDFTTEFPEGEGSRRQDLEPCYIRNGAIYAMTRDCIVNKFSRHGDSCRPYIMDDESSVNIDAMIDFKLAEIIIDEKNKA